MSLGWLVATERRTRNHDSLVVLSGPVLVAGGFNDDVRDNEGWHRRVWGGMLFLWEERGGRMRERERGVRELFFSA